MGMFKMEKPRRLNHQYIYVDERKEKLQKLEEKAKRDLGIDVYKRQSLQNAGEDIKEDMFY